MEKTTFGHSENREYIVEVILQEGDYRGTFKFTVRGTESGLNVLTYFFETYPDVEDLYENNCNLSYGFDGTDHWVTCTLKNNWGDVLVIKKLLPDFERMVVKLEIIQIQDIN